MALTLEMKFNTANGKTITLSVSDPKENITSTEVVTAMQSIIDQDVFHNEGYAIVGISGARMIERNISDLELV